MAAFVLTVMYLYRIYNNVYDLERIEKESIISTIPQIELPQQTQTNTYSKLNNNRSNQSTRNDNNIVTSGKTSKSNKAQNVERDVDCIISIPDIDLLKKVYNGKNREKHLENYELITATPDMKYTNGGNYIICGHASRLYGHSLNRLSEVLEYTQIQIWANNEVENYVVKEVKYVNMNETSKYCNQTKNKQITILSCAKNISPESYIAVIAVPD